MSNANVKIEAELEHLHGQRTVPRTYGWIGVRHIQAFVLFFCLGVNYLMRVNLSIAMVVMTDKNQTKYGYEVFDWSSKQTGLLFSAFFWGYVVMNFSAAVLVTRYNNKTLLLWSVTYSSAATILTPLIVGWGGFEAFIALRVSIGFMQGFMMPVCTGQLSRWIPPNERARCGTLVLGGMHFGTIISFISSGILGNSSGGWPSIFYLSGGLSLAWCFIWYQWGAVGPSTCTYISEEEKHFIQNSLSSSNQKKNVHLAIPWKKIFTNKACYAVAIATTCHNWGFWILVTQMPTFFSKILHFDAADNGLITALPYFCLWIVSFPSSYIIDLLIRKKITPIGFSRKMCNTIGHWGAAICLLALGYTHDRMNAIVMYTIGVTLTGFIFMGFNINLLDICPNFAGLLMGLTNGTAALSAIVGPIFVGFIVYDTSNVDLWRTIFYVSAAVFFFGNLSFIILGSGEVQEFNNITNETTEEEKGGVEKKVES